MPAEDALEKLNEINNKMHAAALNVAEKGGPIEEVVALEEQFIEEYRRAVETGVPPTQLTSWQLGRYPIHGKS